jgi:hypothetical protein
MTPELTTVMMFLSLLILLAGFPIAFCIRRFERPARAASAAAAAGTDREKRTCTLRTCPRLADLIRTQRADVPQGAIRPFLFSGGFLQGTCTGGTCPPF